MKHYLSALIGFTIWGTFALVLRPLAGYPALDILIHRVIIASVSIVFACFIFRKRQTLASIDYIRNATREQRWRLLVNLLLSALMLGLNWYIFIYVMNAVSVNATSLAYLICPILTTVLARVFLHEKLNKGQWTAVVLSGVSCVILAYGHFLDLIYSMTIALTYAIYLVLQKNSFKIDGFFALTIHIVVSTLLLLPILAVIDPALPRTNTFYVLVAVIAVGYTIVPLFLNIYALKGLDSSIVATLLNLNPIISFLLAVCYYKEPINIFQIAGFGLVFIAVVIFNVAYLFGKRRNSVRIYTHPDA